MPTGPKGQRRPADTVGAAVMVAKIATGEIVEELEKPSGRVKSGKAGGRARAESLTPAQRKSIAKKAANARWG